MNRSGIPEQHIKAMDHALHAAVRDLGRRMSGVEEELRVLRLFQMEHEEEIGQW